jgi:phospholipase/carboxylesterase
MSYALAIGEGRPRPAGLIALSCFLPRTEGFSLELEGLDGFPVALGHGTQDPVIPVDFGRRARDVILASGGELLYQEYPLPHMLDPQFVLDVRSWLWAKLATGA